MIYNPLDAPQDYILLAGQRSPGLADIKSADSPRLFDKQKAFALSGSRPRFRGVDLSTFEVVLWLFTTQHWVDWHRFRTLVQRPPLGTRARAMDISHPMLEDLNIHSVVVTNVRHIRDDAKNRFIELHFMQWRPPVFQLSTVAGSRDTDSPDPAAEGLDLLAQALRAEGQGDSDAGGRLVQEGIRALVDGTAPAGGGGA